MSEPKTPLIAKVVTFVGAIASLFSLWEFMLYTFALFATFVYGVRESWIAAGFWLATYLALRLANSQPRK
jgi:hypothetical protein